MKKPVNRFNKNNIDTMFTTLMNVNKLFRSPIPKYIHVNALVYKSNFYDMKSYLNITDLDSYSRPIKIKNVPILYAGFGFMLFIVQPGSGIDN